MQKFNTSDLFTGYLKQLLASFNLPKLKVYTDEHKAYFEANGEERYDILETTYYEDTIAEKINYFPYLKDDKLQEYINGEWVDIGSTAFKLAPHSHGYSYNKKLLNYTKKLVIKDNIYDSYTHEYLGDYLRFQRDYNNINLMPLYNCFSNRACPKLKLTYKSDEVSFNFDTDDSLYKIYMLPVKLFKEYTIAIESELPFEICCGLYGNYQNKKFNDIIKLTYKKISNSTFSTPILYDKLTKNLKDKDNLEPNTLLEIAQLESDLKLFIKLPKNNKSTIVVLEGNYLNWNDHLFSLNKNEKNELTTLVTTMNKTVINFKYDKEYENNIKLITPLQLLRFNTKEQHPFADRLIEYLTENTITGQPNEVEANISRVQKALSYTNRYTKVVDGVWDPKIQLYLYDFMTNNTFVNNFEINHDILGFVDKDVEKYYNAVGIKSTDTATSLLNIELEEDR